ncbi:ABC transporter substrate-binding protein [Bosea sp. BK604]|uniref:ABC transporter substrate-binding protein n=1 Tax=Bosea sp. BK604 TaxID=2512180 RepID=UPI00104D2A34|nr:ABC transporter substrate-binding protein [Bosea sp. BK604]TCR70437.1 4,5-dihydroxyphthalate decarboxylase [Bosea sp. BK604]
MLPITIATGSYDRVQAIIDGTVPVQGCAVSYFPLDIEEVTYRTFEHAEFDVAEVSFSNYMVARSRGALNYIAIPVFTSRMFRHSAIYIRDDAGIREPQDLRGRRVGVPTYAMTAALWMRGILASDFDVQPSQIEWRTGGLEQSGRAARFPLDAGPDVRIVPIEPGQTLSAMLRDGEIDALITARAPSCFTQRAPGISRLFPDYRRVEQDYYRRTGLFPIMHGIAVRETLAQAHPWLPNSLLKAFQDAKSRALAGLDDLTASKLALPWAAALAEEAASVMGADFWRYGFKDNLPELEIMTAWADAQGLTARRMTPAELFHPATRGRAYV